MISKEGVKEMRKAILSVMLALCMLLPFVGSVYAAGMENFVPPEEGVTDRFQDVPEGAWYEEALERCCASGLMEGTGADTFTPEGSLTRAQALVMAVRVRMIYYTGQCQLEESKSFLHRVYGGSLSKMVLGFVESGTLSPQELEELKALVNQQEQRHDSH